MPPSVKVTGRVREGRTEKGNDGAGMCKGSPNQAWKNAAKLLWGIQNEVRDRQAGRRRGSSGWGKAEMARWHGKVAGRHGGEGWGGRCGVGRGKGWEQSLGIHGQGQATCPGWQQKKNGEAQAAGRQHVSSPPREQQMGVPGAVCNHVWPGTGTGNNRKGISTGM